MKMKFLILLSFVVCMGARAADDYAAQLERNRVAVAKAKEEKKVRDAEYAAFLKKYEWSMDHLNPNAQRDVPWESYRVIRYPTPSFCKDVISSGGAAEKCESIDVPVNTHALMSCERMDTIKQKRDCMDLVIQGDFQLEALYICTNRKSDGAGSLACMKAVIGKDYGDKIQTCWGKFGKALVDCVTPLESKALAPATLKFSKDLFMSCEKLKGRGLTECVDVLNGTGLQKEALELCIQADAKDLKDPNFKKYADEEMLRYSRENLVDCLKAISGKDFGGKFGTCKAESVSSLTHCLWQLPSTKLATPSKASFVEEGSAPSQH